MGGPDPFELYDNLDREDGNGITLNSHKKEASFLWKASQVGNLLYFIGVILLASFSMAFVLKWPVSSGPRTQG